MTHSDILIIGGGVAGLTAAAALPPDASVTLLEAEDQLAFHASGRSAAMFIESYGNATVRALNEASTDHHLHADGGVLKPRAVMLLARHGDAEAFATEAADFGAAPMPLDEAQQRFPLLDPATTGHAALREDTYDLDTDLLIQNARRTALSHGAQILSGERVTAIEKGQHWQVTTSKGTHTAGIVINAAGAWADQIAALAGLPPIGLTPFRRSMARIPLPDGLDPANWPFVDGIGEAWYAKPDAGRLIVSPSEEHASEPMDAWADDMVIAEGLARFEEFVTMEVTRVIATWAGLRTFAPDRALVIGPEPLDPSFFWLAGQGGYGFQTAPAAARLIRAHVTGAAPELPAATVTALTPARFRA